VWAIADTKRQGYLGFSDFIIAMQVKMFIHFLNINADKFPKSYSFEM